MKSFPRLSSLCSMHIFKVQFKNKKSYLKFILCKWRSLRKVIKLSYQSYENPIDKLNSTFRTLMDIMDDEIESLPKSKRKQYSKMIINIVTLLSDLSRMVERDVKYSDLPIDDLKLLYLYHDEY